MDISNKYLKGEEIVEVFHEKGLQKPNLREFKIEKVINRKGNKFYVNPIQDEPFRDYSRMG